MLLIASMAIPVGVRAAKSSPPARHASGLRGVGCNLFLDHRAIALEPVLHLHELAALDGPDLHPAAAFMVGRAELHRRNEAAQGEALDRFHAFLYVLAGGRGTTLGFNSVADRLDVQRRAQDAAVVVDGRVHFLGRRLALGLVHGLDLLQDWEVLADAGELEGVVAFRYTHAAGSDDVGLGAAPNKRDHFAERVALALQLLDGNRRRAPEQMRNDEVGLEAAGDVEDLRAHFQAGRRNGKGAQLEAFGLGKFFQNGQWLLARRIVVEEIGDLLALEGTQLLLDELHRRTGLRPVAGGDRKDVGEALPVGRSGRAETRSCAEDLVLLQFLAQRGGLRRAIDEFHHRAFLLEALVGFHRRRHLVLVVDLEDLDLVALDSALAVHQGDVVLVARAQHGADRRRRAGTVAL